MECDNHAQRFYEFKTIYHLKSVIEKMDFGGSPTIHLLIKAREGIRTSPAKLGVFPSSFNPLTVSHVELIERAISDFAMDEVLLVLDKKTLDKEVFGATLEDRLLMLFSFCQDKPYISLGLSNRGLFVDKVTALRELYPPKTDIHFIVGYDTIIRVLDPKYYDDREASLEKLFSECSFLAANRGGESVEDISDLFEKDENRKYADRVKTFVISDFLASVSSTQIRDLVTKGKSITDFVPIEIEEFISETGLYGPDISVGSERINIYNIRCQAIEHLWALNPIEPPQTDLKKIITAARGDTPLGKEVRRVLLLSPRQIPPRPAPRIPSQPTGNFDLVTPLFPLQKAQQEARRCLQCQNPPCERHCLPGLPILELLKLIARGAFEGAYVRMREAEPLCGMTEYLCQTKENYCERHCLSRQLFGTGNEIAIQTVFRSLWEYGHRECEDTNDLSLKYKINLGTRNKKVAIVGSGPAGLKAAMDLAKHGYNVTIFERKEKIGGVPRFETPIFRFPAEEVFNHIEKDIRALSIHIEAGVTIGQNATIEKLKQQGFTAIFVATGLTLPKRLDIPGEDLKGVSTSIDIFNEFHRNGLNDLMKRFKDKKCYVIDSGNTAMDTSRLLRRLGAEVTSIFWEDAPRAYPKEIAAAEKEGISFLCTSLPVGLVGDNQGVLTHIKSAETTFDEKTERWKPIPGTDRDLPTDFCIYAIGAHPDVNLENLNITKEGHIQVDPVTLQTSIPALYAGGDVVERGNISTAIRDGRRAAESIYDFCNAEAGKL
ncbi:MAG: FAD-dependent oxidoreductase [Gemmatimonadota bacterium]|nr:MAG: FAD-dependent oxidoreductase [Gemmatimonadota bacterium]